MVCARLAAPSISGIEAAPGTVRLTEVCGSQVPGHLRWRSFAPDLLGSLGDASSKDVRRAKAVGVLAQPQQALALFDHTGTTPIPLAS